MNNKNIIKKLTEIKENLQNDLISSDSAEHEILEIEKQLQTFEDYELLIKANPLKSLFIIFNQNNFSDLSLFFRKSGASVEIIEIAGDKQLGDIVSDFLQDDPGFYSDLEKIEISGEHYRVFSESMLLDDSVYTMLSLTSSNNFKSSVFHMLCDIVMDYNKSLKTHSHGIFCDLFDDTLIQMNMHISDSSKIKPLVYYFRYEYINEFLKKIGLVTIIEMSDNIKEKLVELFGNEAQVIRLSLSSYVVIAVNPAKEDIKISQFINKNKIDFIYKGIVLPYTVIQIPYENGHSSYDIFENVYHLDNYLKTGDVRL